MRPPPQPTPAELDAWRELALAVLEVAGKTGDSPRMRRALRVLANKGRGSVVPDAPPTHAHIFVRLQRRAGQWMSESLAGRLGLAAELAELGAACLARLDQIASRQTARLPYREN